MITWKEQPGLAAALSEAGLMCYMLDNKWVVDDPVAVQAFIDSYVPDESTRKMIGVEFEGVMCSATAEDQHGLTAVLTVIQLLGPNFQPTCFYFANGNTLTISLANYHAFLSTWLPFRQSFFTP